MSRISNYFIVGLVAFAACLLPGFAGTGAQPFARDSEITEEQLQNIRNCLQDKGIQVESLTVERTPAGENHLLLLVDGPGETVADCLVINAFRECAAKFIVNVHITSVPILPAPASGSEKPVQLQYKGTGRDVDRPLPSCFDPTVIADVIAKVDETILEKRISREARMQKVSVRGFDINVVRRVKNNPFIEVRGTVRTERERTILKSLVNKYLGFFEIKFDRLGLSPGYANKPLAEVPSPGSTKPRR